MEHVRHIFFDLDHTLWDFDANSAETLTELFHDLNLKEHIDHPLSFIHRYKRVNAKYWDLYNHGKITKEPLRLGRFRDTFQSFDFTPDEKYIAHFADEYLNRCPLKPHLIEGAREVLEHCVKHYELHIISNGFIDPTNCKIDSAGIREYFQTITSSEEVGVNKPNPKVFSFALEKAQAQNSESAMIGDNLKADVIGALNAGMTPVLYRDGKVRSNPKYHHVSNLLDLINLFPQNNLI